MRLIIALGLVVALAGCGQSYRVTESDDRFSTSPDRVVSAHGCQISSAGISGGLAFGGTGLYVNPVIFKDKKTGEVKGAGFFIENKYDRSTLYGSPNALGLIESAVFNVDGEVIPLEIGKSVGSESSGGVYYNSVDKSSSVQMQDRAAALVPASKLEAIIRGKVIAFKIVGTKGAMTYEDKDITRSYRESLARFGVEQMGLTGITLPPPPEPRKAGKGK